MMKLSERTLGFTGPVPPLAGEEAEGRPSVWHLLKRTQLGDTQAEARTQIPSQKDAFTNITRVSSP